VTLTPLGLARLSLFTCPSHACELQGASTLKRCQRGPPSGATWQPGS
jgi:hypothetical protein